MQPGLSSCEGNSSVTSWVVSGLLTHCDVPGRSQTSCIWKLVSFDSWHYPAKVRRKSARTVYTACIATPTQATSQPYSLNKATAISKLSCRTHSDLFVTINWRDTIYTKGKSGQIIIPPEPRWGSERTYCPHWAYWHTSLWRSAKVAVLLVLVGNVFPVPF